MLQQPANGIDDGSTNGDSVSSTISSNDHVKSTSVSVQNRLSDQDVDIIRLIGQYLRDLGLHGSVDHLMKESGLRLDHPAASRFRDHILDGMWVQAEEDLNELQTLLNQSDDVLKMRFLLLEQKYLELLESGEAIAALEVLRHQLTPLKYNVQRVHQLSSCIMCNAADELRQQSGWPGGGQVSRRQLLVRLQAFLPATVMVPPGRLRQLLGQAVQLQRNRCRFHNSVDADVDDSCGSAEAGDRTDCVSVNSTASLLSDHACSRDDFPSESLHLLTEHTDEVWFCSFSPDGASLASGSKDATVLVWDVDLETYAVRLRHTLLGPIDGTHGYAVCYLCWSPDSCHFLAAHESPDIFLWDGSRGCLEKRIIHSGSDTILCAAWHPSGDRFACGGTHGQFYLYDIRGTMLDRWEGVRVRSLAFSADGNAILAADTHNRVCAYRQDDHKQQEILSEMCDVMSMSVNAACTLAALNVANQGVHLWDLEDKVLVQRFQGVTQGAFTVHSCFGGVNQNFIASGSEEHSVYIWHRNRERPLVVLPGHTSTVSCVAWNPRAPGMLASCSDDCTVRVWAPPAFIRAQQRHLSGGDVNSDHSLNTTTMSPNGTTSHSSV